MGPKEDEALLQELRTRHPEFYGNGAGDACVRRGRTKKAAVPTLEAPVLISSLRRATEEPASHGTIADFVDGAFALTLMPAAACSPAERSMFFSEVVPLRQALMQQYELEQVADAMLIDAAVVSFFEARILSSKATALLSSAQIDRVRAGEIVSKAAHRAHSRFVAALELLRRGRSPQVKFEVEAVQQLHVGDQVISLGPNAAVGR